MYTRVREGMQSCAVLCYARWLGPMGPWVSGVSCRILVCECGVLLYYIQVGRCIGSSRGLV